MRRRSRRQLFWRIWLFLPLLALGACAQDGAPVLTGPPEQSGATAGPAEATATQAVTATPLVLPTLLPSQTPVVAATQPVAQASATPATLPTAQSTIDFEQPVVELRYRIPALQLDRRLEGNVSGQITVVDETQGVASIRPNQGAVLLELQEILPALELEPLPEDCLTCVSLSYQMPLLDIENEGWLQDPVLLASVENYTSAHLGPHFPPGTVVGLRRSATAYDVAHTLALTADGSLYRWLATAAQVDDAVAAATAAPDLRALVDALEGETLADQYVVSCAGAPVETLFLHGEATAESGGMLADEGRAVRIACPAFSLPQALLPLYMRLDGLLEETLAGSGLPRPPSEVALSSLLDYRREDGFQLALAADGTARVADEAGETVTTTLSSSEVISLTTALLNSDVLQAGLTAFTAGELPNTLLVRGDQGLLEAAWTSGATPAAIEPLAARLNEIIETTISEP